MLAPSLRAKVASHVLRRWAFDLSFKLTEDLRGGQVRLPALQAVGQAARGDAADLMFGHHADGLVNGTDGADCLVAVHHRSLRREDAQGASIGDYYVVHEGDMEKGTNFRASANWEPQEVMVFHTALPRAGTLDQ
jgi:hypothetical protein